jgi:hypothetical protein
MQIPKAQLITALIATILIFTIATYFATTKNEVFAQATACKVVDIYEAPVITLTYKRPPDETGVRVERRMETQSKPNPLYSAHPTTPTLAAKTVTFTDSATAQSSIEDVTYHYRFMTFNADGDNGVWSDPVCKTIRKLRQPPMTPVVVIN